MRNRYARILAAGCAAVLAATLAAAPALAAPALAAPALAVPALAAGTWTIQPGGAIKAASAGRFGLKDTTTGTLFSCVSAAASGTLKHGSGQPGSHAGSLSAVGITTCTGPGISDSDVIVTLRATGLPWHVNLSSYNAATGVVTGTVSHLQITQTGPAGCTAVIDGTSGTASDGKVKFTYTDSTGRLTVLATTGNLHFYDVTGCLGLVNTGDRATLGATFTLSPKQAITSP